MRIGTILPTFRETFDEAKDALLAVRAHSIDCAFVYDHFWPMFHPELPAIAAFPALGALSVHAGPVSLGTLVARVGVVDPEVLVREVLTANALNGGHFIAGIGTADKKGAAEYLAYGLGFKDAGSRRAELGYVARRLIDSGIEVWIGGGRKETNDLAREIGATLNLWGATPERIENESRLGAVSWAGNLPEDPILARQLVTELERAGATHAVFAWPGTIDRLVDAAGAREAGSRGPLRMP